MSLEEGLHWIATHQVEWAFSSIAFILSLILCVAGLAIFNQFFQLGEAQFIIKIAFYTFLIGAIFRIITMGIRLRIGPWAAQIFSETALLPDSFTPLSLLESAFFDIFMLSTFMASSIYGFALLNSAQFPNGLGWFSVAYGLFGVVSYAISGGLIPIMVLAVPLVLGMAPLPSPEPQ